MFYMKNCKNDALLVKNLQRECFFNPRNPRGTLFRTGRPLGTKTPLYYFVHENPYKRSCWGTMKIHYVWKGLHANPQTRTTKKATTTKEHILHGDRLVCILQTLLCNMCYRTLARVTRCGPPGSTTIIL